MIVNQKKIPYEIEQDFYDFKVHGQIHCPNCKQQTGNFYNININQTKLEISFWFYCKECLGNDWCHIISFDELFDLFVNWYFNHELKKNEEKFLPFRLFMLGCYYNTCFLNIKDKNDFKALKEKLQILYERCMNLLS
jgi:hypothetical protein